MVYVDEHTDVRFFQREPPDNESPDDVYPEEMTSYKDFDLLGYAPEDGVHLEPAGTAGQFEYIYIKCWEFRGPSVLKERYDGRAHEAIWDCPEFLEWIWRDNPEPCHWRSATLYPTPGVAVQLPWDFVIGGGFHEKEKRAASFAKQCQHMDPCQALLYKLTRALLQCRQLPCPRNQCGWYRALAVRLLRLAEEHGYNRSYVYLDLLQQAQG